MNEAFLVAWCLGAALAMVAWLFDGTADDPLLERQPGLLMFLMVCRPLAIGIASFGFLAVGLTSQLAYL